MKNRGTRFQNLLILFSVLLASAHAQDFISSFTPSHSSETYAFTLTADSVVTLVSTLSGTVNAGNSGFGITGADRTTDVVRPAAAHPGLTEGPWPLKAGTYYLTVWNNANSTGSYSASLRSTPVGVANDNEANDSATAAIALAAGIASTGHLGFYDAASHDYSDFYAVSLSVAGTLGIATTFDTTFNGAFGTSVYQSDGQTLVRDTSIALPAGKYYVQVWTNSGFSFGGYTLTANFTPNTTGSLTPLAKGNIVVQTAVTSARAVNPTLIFAPAPEQRHGTYQLYVAGLYAGQFYFLTLQNFQMAVVAYTGGDLPVYQLANGAELYVDQPNGGFAAQTWTIGLGDLSTLGGLQLVVGFGRSAEDMLARGQVQVIYTVP